MAMAGIGPALPLLGVNCTTPREDDTLAANLTAVTDIYSTYFPFCQPCQRHDFRSQKVKETKSRKEVSGSESKTGQRIFFSSFNLFVFSSPHQKLRHLWRGFSIILSSFRAVELSRCPTAESAFLSEPSRKSRDGRVWSGGP